jgi:hypothetical protein
VSIDDRILRKWTKKLADSLEPGERLVAFDRGREEAVLQKRIDVVVSTHATYIGMGFGRVVRVRHEDVMHVQLAGANGIMLTTRLAQELGQPGWCIYTNHMGQELPDHIHEQWLARRGRDDGLAAWQQRIKGGVTDSCVCGHPAGRHAYDRPCTAHGCGCKHFQSRAEVEAEVNGGMATKQERLDRIEAVLAKPDLDAADLRVKQLKEERHHLRTFFWLARGGDRSGEPFANPSRDLSAEEVDLLAKRHALQQTRE